MSRCPRKCVQEKKNCTITFIGALLHPDPLDHTHQSAAAGRLRQGGQGLQHLATGGKTWTVMPRPAALTLDAGDGQKPDSASALFAQQQGDADGGKVGPFAVTPFVSTEEFVAQEPAAENVLRQGMLHKRIVSKRIYWAERIVTLTSDRIFLAKANGESGELERRDELKVLDITRVQQVAHSSHALNTGTMRDMGRG